MRALTQDTCSEIIPQTIPKENAGMAEIGSNSFAVSGSGKNA
jgi:hypothetical protein